MKDGQDDARWIGDRAKELRGGLIRRVLAVIMQRKALRLSALPALHMASCGLPLLEDDEVMEFRQPSPLTTTELRSVHWHRNDRRVHLDPEIEPFMDQNVYRYGSLTEALALVGDGQWQFKRPDAWEDPYEKHIGKQLFGAEGPFGRIRAYAKCFSFEYHSEPMWRLFRSADGLVRMAFKLGDLVKTLESATHSGGKQPKLYIGRARYMPQAALRTSVNQLRKNPPKAVSQFAMHALLMKRNGFIFENEIRACFLFRQDHKLAETTIVGGIDSSVINDILLDPYASPPVAQAWKRMLKEVHGVQCSVEQSKFNLDPEAFT